MIISLIAAMSENRVIGNKNTIPWDIPADRKRFKAITLGHPVIMGRKTFETIGHALPGRRNIIITRQRDYKAYGCLIAHDLPEAISMAGDGVEAFICGGGDIYRQAIPLATKIYLTIIHETYEGDTFFPEIPAGFQNIENERVEDFPSFSFLVLAK